MSYKKSNKFSWLMTGATLLAAAASLTAGQVGAAKKAYTGWKNTKAGRVFYQNGKKLKSTFLVRGGYVYYLKKNGAMIKNKTSKVKGKKVKFDKKGHATSLRGKTQINGYWYYFDKKGKMARNKAIKDSKYVYHYSATGKLKSALSSLKGKKYFIDAKSGKPRTNFTYKSGSKWYHFGKNGLGTTSYKVSVKKASGLINTDKTFAANNQAYSLTSSSIENVDGYLTADTWYRPKKILKNGTTWTKSTASDKRPLLMVYWPNKTIFVDYLNYMKKNGYLNSSVTYTTSMANKDLFAAANEIQKNVEKKISSQKSTDWLKTLMSSFKDTESIWNKSSEDEDYSGMQLQGGFYRYENNAPATPWTSSKWRLMGRWPNNLYGGEKPLTEFLLANDIDNSNPVVQAEQLNLIYYLLNLGPIMDRGNNPSKPVANGANADAYYDSIRVDAVDYVDADLLNILGQYFKAAYGMDTEAKSNAHLNILEDWTTDMPTAINKMGNPGITMDSKLRSSINSAFGTVKDSMSASEKADRLKNLITGSLVDRSNDNTSGKAIPSYTFVRAHDSDSQDQIRQAISQASGKPYGQFNQADEEKGIDLFLKDQNSTDKTYNLYNIPLAYSVLLTNKDMVPRVYYGDMYTDGGQYMSKKTRYYQTITNLLKTRMKYVSGNQTMNVDNNGVLTSVRTGKSRTEGIGVVVSNNSSLALKDDEKVTLHMGSDHKNQEYRAVVLPTDKAEDNGAVANSYLKNYTSDDNAPTAKTDDNGDLVFTNKNLKIDGKEEEGTAVKGYSNPDMKGYLAVWVPVGAKSDQDARTKASTDKTDGKSMYTSDAALDSNVIFEGFSNFIYYPTKDDEATNAQIAKNAASFKDLGITIFEMAPQYISSKDKTFLDSTIDNGYAFDDRYDVALSEKNKYGSNADLMNALKALHKAGLQAMADWVPNQMYNLKGKEATTVSRADDHGNQMGGDDLHNFVYITETVGGGAYQKKYGGAFLNEIKQKYPDLFKIKQVSTGQPIDPSVKITQWSAKYLNGTNIMHKGAGYVLKDANGYFNVGYTKKDGDKTYKIAQKLPAQLTGTSVKAEGKNYSYYDENGKKVTASFVKDDSGNWYYFDKDGNLVKTAKFTVIGNATYFFTPDGVSVRDGLVNDGKHTFYLDKNGRLVKNKTVKSGNYTYKLDKKGYLTSEKYTAAVVKKAPAKKSPAKKTTAKKSSAKKTTKKSSTKKTTSKKTSTKKTSSKKK